MGSRLSVQYIRLLAGISLRISRQTVSLCTSCLELSSVSSSSSRFCFPSTSDLCRRECVSVWRVRGCGCVGWGCWYEYVCQGMWGCVCEGARLPSCDQCSPAGPHSAAAAPAPSSYSRTRTASLPTPETGEREEGSHHPQNYSTSFQHTPSHAATRFVLQPHTLRTSVKESPQINAHQSCSVPN